MNVINTDIEKRGNSTEDNKKKQKKTNRFMLTKAKFYISSYRHLIYERNEYSKK
jgi:hypothetical protein